MLGPTRIFFFLNLVLFCANSHAQINSFTAVDSTELLDSLFSQDQPSSPNPLRILTGHGLSLGHGRSSIKGLHGLDSLSLALRQFPGAGRLSEKISANTDYSFTKSELQSANTHFTLQFREHGLTLQTEAGLTYASLIYNSLSRTEKIKGQTEWVGTFSANASKAFTLDADSTWEWTLGGGYDNYGGDFKTWDGYTSLEKTWKDFNGMAQASSFQQRQSQVKTVKCKDGFGKACSQLRDNAAIDGLGLALLGEWDHDVHFVSAKIALDWEFTTTGSSRYRTIGAGYIYSPLDWLDLGISAMREKALDAVKGGSYWLLGSTVSLTY